ncbi:MAG: STAS domain-containing protein [Candidatus Hydrothermales bacterium]
MKPFEVKIFKKDNVIYVNLKGKIDTRTVNDFKEALEKVKSEAKEKIVISYKDVDYVSSAGYGALLKFCVYSKKENKSVIVTGMKPEIKNIFDIMELYRFIEYKENLQIPQFLEEVEMEKKREPLYEIERWLEEKVVDNPMLEPEELFEIYGKIDKNITLEEFKDVLKRKKLFTKEERLLFAYMKLKEKILK